MIEGLIVFAEDTLFSRVSLILEEQSLAPARCRNIVFLLLSFVERNPGFARLFVGDALLGETERLRIRMHQLMSRFETQLRQVIREHNARQVELPVLHINATANLLLSLAEGKILQFVRSDFSLPPTQGWEEQWQLLDQVLFAQPS